MKNYPNIYIISRFDKWCSNCCIYSLLYKFARLSRFNIRMKYLQSVGSIFRFSRWILRFYDSYSYEKCFSLNQLKDLKQNFFRFYPHILNFNESNFIYSLIIGDIINVLFINYRQDILKFQYCFNIPVQT